MARAIYPMMKRTGSPTFGPRKVRLNPLLDMESGGLMALELRNINQALLALLLIQGKPCLALTVKYLVPPIHRYGPNLRQM